MYDRLKAVFEKIAVGGEIIFVNDGSPDDAAAVLLELAKPGPHGCGRKPQPCISAPRAPSPAG